MSSRKSDPEDLDAGGGIEKIRRTNRPPREKGEEKGRGRPTRRRETAEPIEKESVTMATPTTQTPQPQKTQTVRSLRDLPRPEPTPFGSALYAARKINTPRPVETQPNELTALEKAMAQLDEQGRKNLVFRLQRDTVEGKCELGGLFAAARIARMLGVASATAAVLKTGLTFDGLRSVGLANVVTDRNGNAYAQYRFGHDNLVTAAKQLRASGNGHAAQTLEAYISQGQRMRALREAARVDEEAKESTDAEA